MYDMDLKLQASIKNARNAQKKPSALELESSKVSAIYSLVDNVRFSKESYQVKVSIHSVSLTLTKANNCGMA